VAPIGWNDGHSRPFDVAVAGLHPTLPGWRRRVRWGPRGRRGPRVIVALAINHMSGCVPEREIGNARQGAEKPFIFPTAERLCDLTQPVIRICRRGAHSHVLSATAGAKIRNWRPASPPAGHLKAPTTSMAFNYPIVAAPRRYSPSGGVTASPLSRQSLARFAIAPTEFAKPDQRSQRGRDAVAGVIAIRVSAGTNPASLVRGALSRLVSAAGIGMLAPESTRSGKRGSNPCVSGCGAPGSR
jgi:hypothetical protein